MGALLRLGTYFVVSFALLLLTFRFSKELGWWLVCGGALWFVLARLWLPRAAHKAFVLGKLAKSRWLYEVLYWMRPGRSARAQTRLSIAANHLMAGNYAAAEQLIAQLSGHDLDDATKAVWLNNHAYLALMTGQNLETALSSCRQALALRPHVPGFLHTEGAILMELGETAKAIERFERLASVNQVSIGGDLESQRCFHLGLSWQKKGESEYGRDYFLKAYQASPESKWGQLALKSLSPSVSELDG